LLTRLALELQQEVRLLEGLTCKSRLTEVLHYAMMLSQLLERWLAQEQRRSSAVSTLKQGVPSSTGW